MRSVTKGFQGILAAAAAAVLVAGGATTANALSCSIGAGNVGLASVSCTLTGTTIDIFEDWGNSNLGSVLMSDLSVGVDYTVVKHIRNNSGESWTRLANELLDPSGNANDALDPAIQPPFVPAGFSTSNDSDGLSFAQGNGAIPKTSDVFGSFSVDELSDARDFIDFFDGTLADEADGSSVDGKVSYGLRLGADENNPFLLVQRPNAFSAVPEPVTLALLGAGLLGLGIARRRRSN